MSYTIKYHEALDAACRKAETDYNNKKEFSAVVADAFRAGMTFQYKHGFILFAEDLMESDLPKDGQLYIVITTSNKALLCRCSVSAQTTGKYNFSYPKGSGAIYYTFNVVGGGMLAEEVGAWTRFVITK